MSGCPARWHVFGWRGGLIPLLGGGLTGVVLWKVLVAVGMTFASSEALISSSKESKAWEVSGFIN